MKTILFIYYIQCGFDRECNICCLYYLRFHLTMGLGKYEEMETIIFLTKTKICQTKFWHGFLLESVYNNNAFQNNIQSDVIISSYIPTISGLYQQQDLYHAW